MDGAIPKEREIGDFWQEHPCGENLTGHLADWQTHFDNYDRFRYGTERHILEELDRIGFSGKRVLEIGIGQAADSVQIAKRGAEWNGLDLTEAAVERARIRFQLCGIEYGAVKQGSAIEIPWSDKTFDIVYSHGVLHHIPDVTQAAKEIHRVLKDQGRLIVMLYHKNSLNYYLSILLIRRVLFSGVYALSRLGMKRLIKSKLVLRHIENAEKHGLLDYLKSGNFIHPNTDGPENPYSKVYILQEVKEDFRDFVIEGHSVHFLNLRHFPGLRFLPDRLLSRMEARWGWHLWIFMRKKAVQ